METANSKKRKSDGAPARKGPLPQVDLETLNDLVGEFQPTATTEAQETGRRWDKITEAYNQRKPNFNGFGYKDKKALRNFFSVCISMNVLLTTYTSHIQFFAM